MQDRPKSNAVHEGGWRYWGNHDQSDLSITSWQLMFLRSAKNAGVDVKSDRIDRVMRYIIACYDRDDGHFRYTLSDTGRLPSRAMTGAGILALAHGGMYDHQIAQRAGDWLLARPYTDYLKQPQHELEHFHYGVFYSTAAMYQLGGRRWRQFSPQTVQTLLRHQNGDGSWHPEGADGAVFGNVYTTALVVMALNVPSQLLPIMQR